MSELVHNGRIYISVLEAAQRKGCHPETIKLWIQHGRLAAIRISRRLWAVDIEALNSLQWNQPTVGPGKGTYRPCDVCGDTKYYSPSAAARTLQWWRRCRKCVTKYGFRSIDKRSIA